MNTEHASPWQVTGFSLWWKSPDLQLHWSCKSKSIFQVTNTPRTSHLSCLNTGAAMPEQSITVQIWRDFTQVRHKQIIPAKAFRFVPLRLPASVWFTVSGILFLEQRERWQICSSQHYLYSGKENQSEKCYTAHPPVIYKTNTEAREQPDTTHYHQDSSLLLTLCHRKGLHVFLQRL